MYELFGFGDSAQPPIALDSSFFDLCTSPLPFARSDADFAPQIATIYRRLDKLKIKSIDSVLFASFLLSSSSLLSCSVRERTRCITAVLLVL